MPIRSIVQLCRRMVHHLARQPQGVLVGQHGVVALLPEVGEIQVVDDFGDHVLEAFDQRDAGVAVASHAKRFEHQLAELMRGRDRRRVETRQGIA